MLQTILDSPVHVLASGIDFGQLTSCDPLREALHRQRKQTRRVRHSSGCLQKVCSACEDAAASGCPSTPHPLPDHCPSTINQFLDTCASAVHPVCQPVHRFLDPGTNVHCMGAPKIEEPSAEADQAPCGPHSAHTCNRRQRRAAGSRMQPAEDVPSGGAARLQQRGNSKGTAIPDTKVKRLKLLLVHLLYAYNMHCMCR